MSPGRTDRYASTMTEPRDPYAGSDRKSEIRGIAAELFARNGYHATGITELCEAVGLGKGALYHHIGSKEELLYEISAQHVIELVEFGERLSASDVSPVEKLRRLSRYLMRTIADHLPEVTVFFTEWRSLTGQRAEELLALRERFEAVWVATLEEGVKRKVFRSADPLLIKGLLGLHNYAYLWIDQSGARSPEEISDLFCDQILRGLLKPDAVDSSLV